LSVLTKDIFQKGKNKVRFLKCLLHQMFKSCDTILI